MYFTILLTSLLCNNNHSSSCVVHCTHTHTHTHLWMCWHPPPLPFLLLTRKCPTRTIGAALTPRDLSFETLLSRRTLGSWNLGRESETRRAEKEFTLTEVQSQPAAATSHSGGWRDEEGEQRGFLNMWMLLDNRWHHSPVKPPNNRCFPVWTNVAADQRK